MTATVSSAELFCLKITIFGVGALLILCTSNKLSSCQQRRNLMTNSRFTVDRVYIYAVYDECVSVGVSLTEYMEG